MRPTVPLACLLLALLAAGGGCGHGEDGASGPLDGPYVGQEVWISYGPAVPGEGLRRTGRSREEAQAIADDLHARVLAGADIGKLAQEHSNLPGVAKGFSGVLPRDPAHPDERDRALAHAAVGEVTPVVEWNRGFYFARRVDLATGAVLARLFEHERRLRARIRVIALLYVGAWIPDAEAREKVKRTREQAVALADMLLKKLKAGASFEELARRHSEDGPSAKNGGIVTIPVGPGLTTEWIRRQDPGVPASVLEAAFTTPVGELCPHVIVSERGVFVLKVEERREVEDQ